ncbi:outer membrane receptor protein involved in Fe transport [Sphingomonas zeicaulis]|uniref:TonB-dependent receptor n=1 Tax=Sphingomonas zeicaulis TaxID=1632740 RepID=UPI003D22D2A6
MTNEFAGAATGQRTLFRLAAGASLLMLATAAHAEAAPDAAPEPAPDAAAGADDAIVVTALKREVRLQDAPASITAIGDATLRAANIDALNDLTRAVPSLTITDQGPGQRRITLRGIRSAGDAQVGIYYDDTPVAGPPGTTSDPGGSQSDFKLFDAERIEVLRGPQGTLYGAGSVGGTIRIVNRKPTFDFEGKADLIGTTTKDGGEGYQINVALNVPIVNDVLAARAVYFRRDVDGWVDNPGLGLKGINSEKTDGGRLLVRFIPTDWLTIDGAVHLQYTEGGASTWSPGAGKYNAVNLSQVPYEDKQRIYSLTGNADLGFASLVFNAAYQDRDTLVTRDPSYLFRSFKGSAANCRTRFSAAVCATPAGITAFNAYVDSLTPVIYYQPQSVKSWTSEARLQSSGTGPLQWAIGLFYEDRDAEVLSEARRTAAGDGSQIDGAAPLLQRNVVDHLVQKAVFGEATYELVEGLKITGGFRYYDYKKVVGGDTVIGLDILRTSPTPFATYRADRNGWLYKANISYAPTRNLLLYAQVANGFRPGGVNQVLGLAQALAYAPDKLVTYEGGIKATLLDGALTANLSGYFTDWSDMQVSINSGTFVYLGNAGAAEIKGGEFELALRPIEGLQFSGNIAVTDAKLTEDQVPDGINPAPNTARAGDKIPFIADATFGVSAQYEWSLGGDLQALVRADANHVGKSRADFRPTAIGYRRLGDYTFANARVGVRTETWGAYLFVNNIFNKVARVAAGNVLGGSIETVTTAPPRTIGMNLTTSF